MSKQKTPFTINENFDHHPAVVAWSKLKLEFPTPDKIEIIRYPTRNHPSVIRLSFANEEGHPVIARGTNLPNAIIEKSVHENLFKYLTKKLLRYYGYVETENNFAWNFMEDAMGIPFSFKNPEHLMLAEDWLSELHTRVPKLDFFRTLGVNHYYSNLHSGYDRITNNLSNRALSHSDITVLKSIIKHFDFLEEHWSKITLLYEQMPKGFIHGDFKPDNLRVRNSGQESTLLVFDWDESGWGIPGIDMHRLNHKNYWLRVRNRLPGATFSDIEQMSNMGKLFRLIVATFWAAKSLAYEWIEKPMGWLTVYEKNLAETIQHIE